MAIFLLPPVGLGVLFDSGLGPTDTVPEVY